MCVCVVVVAAKKTQLIVQKAHGIKWQSSWSLLLMIREDRQQQKISQTRKIA